MKDFSALTRPLNHIGTPKTAWRKVGSVGFGFCGHKASRFLVKCSLDYSLHYTNHATPDQRDNEFVTDLETCHGVLHRLLHDGDRCGIQTGGLRKPLHESTCMSHCVKDPYVRNESC